MIIKDFLLKLVSDEKHAGEMYILLSEKSEPDLAEISLKFSRKEIHHIKILSDLAEKLSDSKYEISSIIDELSPYLDSASEDKEDKEKELDENPDLLKNISKKQFFLYALKKEKDSIAIYEILRNFFKNDTSLEYIFSNLIREEEDHMYFILDEMHKLK